MAYPSQAIYGAINFLIFYSSSTFWTWVREFIPQSLKTLRT